MVGWIDRLITPINNPQNEPNMKDLWLNFEYTRRKIRLSRIFHVKQMDQVG